jgi:DNA-binding CsgD family transcriptional regulator
MSHLEFGDVEAAERWVDLAAQVVATAPTRHRSLQLESWRGRVRAAAGDAVGLRRHLEGAVTLANEQGRASGRCEALARLALEAARLGASTNDAELLALAERSAEQARDLAGQLPGHSPWFAQAEAALAAVALARGDLAAAATAGGAAIESIQDGLHEDLGLEILIPAARAIFAGAPPEHHAPVRRFLEVVLSRIAQGILDESIRVKWLRGPMGRALVELVGPLDAVPAAAAAATDGTPGPAEGVAAGPVLEPLETHLLHLLTEGLTNHEMAVQLNLTDEELTSRLARLLARLGTSSRAEATSLAFRGLAPVGSS